MPNGVKRKIVAAMAARASKKRGRATFNRATKLVRKHLAAKRRTTAPAAPIEDREVEEERISVQVRTAFEGELALELRDADSRKTVGELRLELQRLPLYQNKKLRFLETGETRVLAENESMAALAAAARARGCERALVNLQMVASWDAVEALAAAFRTCALPAVFNIRALCPALVRAKFRFECRQGSLLINVFVEGCNYVARKKAFFFPAQTEVVVEHFMEHLPESRSLTEIIKASWAVLDAVAFWKEWMNVRRQCSALNHERVSFVSRQDLAFWRVELWREEGRDFPLATLSAEGYVLESFELPALL